MGDKAADRSICDIFVSSKIKKTLSEGLWRLTLNISVLLAKSNDVSTSKEDEGFLATIHLTYFASADRGSSGGPSRVQECLRAGLQVSLSAVHKNYTRLNTASLLNGQPSIYISSINTVLLSLSFRRPYKDTQG